MATAPSSAHTGHSRTIGDDIRLLAGMLGDVIREQEGEEHFELEERIRKLSKQFRESDPTAAGPLEDTIDQVAGNLQETTTVVKAFTIYFYLVNLAEVRQRVRVLRQRERQCETAGAAMGESLQEAVEQLHNEGLAGEQLARRLNGLFVQPVFTAHPTESQRRTILLILRRIDQQLESLDRTDRLATERDSSLAEIRNEILLLWQSDDTRTRKPTVLDEVRNNGLYYFETTLFEVIPRIYQQFQRAITTTYSQPADRLPTFLRYGSWIGGDRDGNPFVTTDVTRETLREQQESILRQYNIEIDHLYNELSPSVQRVAVDAELSQSVQRDRDLLQPEENELLDRFELEPYRQKLLIIFRRLRATRQDIADRVPPGSRSPRSYRDVDQFRDDLLLIDRSLRAQRAASVADARLARLLRLVDTFGFRLASLEIRQHASRHRAALTEIFAQIGLADNYDRCSDSQRIDLLTREIRSPRPLTATLNYSDQTNETIRLMRTIREAQRSIDPQAIHAYIISLTASPADILELLLLARDADLFGRLDILPLFETIDDLQRAPQVMQALYDTPVYRDHLQRREQQQQIMIGYSDSNKDGGFLRANWMLYTAQRRLAEVSEQAGVGLTLFHGRGGSLGRGGGPANRAILAQPPTSIRGRIKLTEQGEVIRGRYSDPQIAQRHLEQLTHAVLLSGTQRHREPAQASEAWAQSFDAISELAFQKYRDLVERPNFVQFFEQVTPIEVIDQLNLGSRPARRRQTQSVADLRAIPWVFAWTQTRLLLPSWYGAGTGFDRWIDGDPDRLSLLRQMYREWAFFRTTIDNMHLGLGRADWQTGGRYLQLADAGIQAEFTPLLESEFQLTCRWVLGISERDQLLETEPWLQTSVQRRNPYLDPLNILQVALFRRLRTESLTDDQRDGLRRAILSSVHGIAEGLQTVG